MKALLVVPRKPDPLGPGYLKIASQAAESLERHGIEVHVEHGGPNGRAAQAAGLLRSLVTGGPMQLGLTASAEFRERVGRAIEAGSFDAIVAVHARATPNVPRRHRGRAVALIVDALGLNYSTFRGRVPLPLDLAYRAEGRRMAAFEAQLMRDFGAVAVVSPTDAGYLRARAAEPERVVHLPYAVDLDYFTFRDRPAPAGRPVFVFTGRLSYRPNADAAGLLVTRVWPLLRRRWPEAELRLVGARPGARLVELARRAGVTLLADVPDIRVHLAAATAALVPMRLGGDMQTKVLEAMAAGVPVVCTRFVNAGIAAGEDAQVLVADTPEEYLRQVERILEDPEAARRRAVAARRLIESRHAPAEFGRRLAELCLRLAAGSRLDAPRTQAELLRHPEH